MAQVAQEAKSSDKPSENKSDELFTEGWTVLQKEIEVKKDDIYDNIIAR